MIVRRVGSDDVAARLFAPQPSREPMERTAATRRRAIR
jgi:hypothetical protein